ncbi:hypothetical protein SeMB42_g00930 [Synchytrium endobioticum]|uniref:MIF4G domain-containing protein n=1 Tax=Synchytrium endobioticum TaxID=286115 RepID=A0A507CT20_9FUNG|nr:hypothetical protein SeLEV6574_g05665 [Synchytrium endobioticum]TPX53201.1 hypothetical protein SeMB42_g00930 [Synchytrium endobioticum]
MSAAAPSAGESTPTVRDNDAARLPRRMELRSKNLDAAKTRPEPSVYANLDGSIKKNTSFIKKIKTSLVADQVDALVKDIMSLKLEKYLSEIVAAIAEARFRTSADILAAVEICSLLHQRFKDFTPELIPALVKQIGPPPSTSNMSPEQKEREEAARVTKQRSIMRLLTELYFVGMVVDPPNAKDAILARMIKDLIVSDKDGYANLPLAVTFAKNYAAYFFDVKVQKSKEASLNCEEAVKTLSGDTTVIPNGTVSLTEDVDFLVSKDVQSIIKTFFLDYFKKAELDLVRTHKTIRKMEHANQEHLITKGEISDERQERFEKNMKAYERLLSGVHALADALDQEMPDLPEEQLPAASQHAGSAIITVAVRPDDEDAGTGIWEDDESKSFYEDLLDLRTKVPPALLGERVETKAETAEEIELALAKEQAAAEAPSPSTTPDPSEALDDGNAAVDDDGNGNNQDARDTSNKDDSTPALAPMALLLNRLADAMNRNTIDSLAVEFCYMNTKTTRRKLANQLYSVTRQRLHLLPYYSRLIATLHPYMPDIGQFVIEKLEKNFHFGQKKKDYGFLEEKTKNIRYMAELVKFKIAPPYMAFHYIKILLDTFIGENIEMCCIFLESCGRFLFRTPETSPRMASFLDVMMRKKAAQVVDPRQILLIDNAYYQCNPPNKPAVVKKERPAIQLYILKIVHHDLNRKNVDKVLKQLRKLDWNDPLHVSSVTKVFHKVWKVKYSNLHLLAYMASELMRYYPEFGIGAIDATLEDIRLGIETNLFKWNQRRIAVVKFLGELYNYKMVDSSTIFDTLFLLLTFGHEGGFAKPGIMNPLDAPHDFFRVRLICTLLETCGEYFQKGTSGRRLDDFLTYLELYMYTKAKAPLDIEFVVAETFEMLRPSRRLFASYEEALQAVQDLYSKRVGSDLNTAGAQSEPTPDDATGRPTPEEDEEQEPNQTPTRDKANQDGEGDADEDSGEEYDSDGEVEADDNTNDDNVVVHMPERALEDDPDNDVFDREFSRMIQDSLESRKTAPRPPTFDAPIPAKVPMPMKREAVYNDEVPPDSIESAKKMAFTLLVKKGNKASSKSLVIPAESSLAQAARAQKEAEDKERELLKQLVLSYEERGRLDAAREELLLQNAKTWGNLRESGNSNSGIGSSPTVGTVAHAIHQFGNSPPPQQRGGPVGSTSQQQKRESGRGGTSIRGGYRGRGRGGGYRGSNSRGGGG